MSANVIGNTLIINEILGPNFAFISSFSLKFLRRILKYSSILSREKKDVLATIILGFTLCCSKDICFFSKKTLKIIFYYFLLKNEKKCIFIR